MLPKAPHLSLAGDNTGNPLNKNSNMSGRYGRKQIKMNNKGQQQLTGMVDAILATSRSPHPSST
jgi:hypothetical protein